MNQKRGLLMSRTHQPAALLLLTAMIWGGTFMIVKTSVAVLHPLAVIAHRFTLAFIFLFLIYHKAVRQNWRQCFPSGFTLAVILFFAFTTQTFGLKYTTPAISALLTGLYGIFVALIEAFIYRKTLTPPVLFGLLAATFGLTLITWPSVHLSINPGVLPTIVCAFLFAWHIVVTDRAVTQHDPKTITVIQFAFVAIFAWCSAPLWGQIIPFDFKIWGALIYLGIPATALCFFFQTLAQRQVPPVQTAVILATEPAFATLYSLLFGYELLTWNLVAGALFMIGGLILSALRNLSRR
jgi:drug/metabolite transporter (DMT)-like permease